MGNAEFRQCPHCGDGNPVSATKCESCGASLGDSKPETAEAQQPSPGGQKAEAFGPEGSSPRSKNYFVRHWRGQLSLPVSYWINGLLGNVLILILLVTVSRWRVRTAIPLSVVSSILAYITTLALCVWQLLGIWRAARSHALRGKPRIWGALSCLAVAGAAWLVVTVASRKMLPQTVEYLKILAGDKEISPYTISLLPVGDVEFKGGLRSGCSADFAKFLRLHPSAKTLRINSTGGRFFEATNMAAIVRDAGLQTYASEYCESAATLVFIAGKERIVTENAKVGFHSGASPGATAEQVDKVNEVVRQFMLSAGISKTFINHALATPREQMWFPTIEEMRKAGVITKIDAPEKIAAMNFVRLFEYPGNETSKPEPTGNREIDLLTTKAAEFGRLWGDLFSEFNQAVGPKGGFEPYEKETLQDQEKIGAAIQRSEERSQVVEKYRSRAGETVQWFTNELRSLQLSDSRAARMRDSLQTVASAGLGRTDQFFKRRLNVEIAGQDFLFFLQKNFSRFYFTNSEIVFSEAKDSARYEWLAKAVRDATSSFIKTRREMSGSGDADKKRVD